MDSNHTPRPPGRRARAAAFALLPVLAVVLLSGCGATGGSSDVSTAEAPDNGSSSREGSGAGGEPEQKAQGESAEGSSDGSAAGGSSGKSAADDAELGERAVVHTADLSVEVDDVAAAVDDAKKWVVEADGYVAGQTLNNETSGVPRGSATLKVPEKSFEDALAAMGDLGRQVNLQSNADDVTEEVADVDSRVTSAQSTLKRLRGLLDDADSVSDVLAVETEITSRTSELESLQARQKALQNQTAYATINLELMPPDSFVPEKDPDESIGFLGGLRQGWSALVDFGQGASVVIGTLLPFLVVLAVLASPFALWWRRRRARDVSKDVPDAENAVPVTADTPGDDGDPPEPSEGRDERA